MQYIWSYDNFSFNSPNTPPEFTLKNYSNNIDEIFHEISCKKLSPSQSKTFLDLGDDFSQKTVQNLKFLLCLNSSKIR